MKRSSVLRILMLSIMLVIAAVACQQKLQPKLLMPNEKYYDRLSFSPNGQSLVFGSILGDYIIYVQNIEDSKSKMKINLPFEEGETGGYFYDLCLADEIWITTLYGQVASYNTSAGTWTIHPRISDSLMSTHCHTLFDNNVVIYSYNRIAIYQDGWKSYELPYNSVISGVAHNSQNQVFAVGMRGNLFVLEKGSWKELPMGLEDVEICPRCFGITTDDMLWLASVRQVYAWDPLANTTPIKFDLDLGEEEFITDLFIGPRRQIWIDGTDSFWLIDNKEPQKIIRLKENPGVFYLEKAKERLYFGIGTSIYYYDLKYLIGK